MKEKCPSCKVIGADPYGSVIAEPSELNETSSKIIEMEGIGLPFVPTTLGKQFLRTISLATGKNNEK